jgi:hypothetical protein
LCDELEKIAAGFTRKILFSRRGLAALGALPLEKSREPSIRPDARHL